MTIGNLLIGCLIGMLCGHATVAQSVLAARTIRANSVLSPDDIMIGPDSIQGTASMPAQVIGLEARVAIYQGRPIRYTDIGAPALIDRNQVVMLRYHSGALVISTEGRALGRGGVGDQIRVMNIASRTTVTGTVARDGSVAVSANR